MAVKRLLLTDFRNHEDALLTPGADFVVLSGENGAGKTNILEAVSLLAPGRGLRSAPLSEMAGRGALASPRRSTRRRSAPAPASRPPNAASSASTARPPRRPVSHSGWWCCG
jgi:hypothetical protein